MKTFDAQLFYKIAGRMVALSIAAGAIGCASTTPMAKVDTRAYTQRLVAMPQSQASSTSCKQPASNLETRSAEAMVEYANSCVKIQNWKEVSRAGEAISGRDVNSPWGPYFLSLSAESEGDLQRAVWMAEMSLKRVEDIGLLHYQKGRLLWKLTDYAAALEQLKIAVKLDGALTSAHLFLGQIYFRDQEFDNAGKHFLAVLSVKATDPIALVGLSECRFQSGDARGGLDILDRAVRAHPNQAEFQARQAFVYETMVKDPNRALAIYKNLLELSLKRQIVGKVPANLAQKISELERTVTSGRAVAGKPSGAATRAGSQ